MSAGIAVAPLPRGPVIDLFPTLEPHLVEVIIPFATGTVDEAVRQAAIIAQNAVEAAFDAILGNAPTVLDTLKEIDDAIGNDPNFATTMLTALAAKALKATKVNVSGLATGGGDLSADRTITVPKASAEEGKAGTIDTKAITPLVLNAVLVALFSQPGVLSALLPNSLPQQAGVPWNNNGVIAIS